MAIKSNAACFRLGDLYRDMSTGTGIAVHALGEMDFPELKDAFFRISSRARMIMDEFFPGNDVLEDIIIVADSLIGTTRSMEEASRDSRKRYRRGIEGGIQELVELIENDFFEIAHSACGG